MERRQAGNATNTIRNYLKTFRRFGQWLEREHFVASSPARDIPYPRQEHKPPVIPSINEFHEIRACIRSLPNSPWVNKRFLFLIDFLTLTGARITSARNVRLGDIDFERGSIKLDDPKNNSYYYFPIDGRLERFFCEFFAFREEYLKCYRGKMDWVSGVDDFLFFAKSPEIAMGEKTIRRQFSTLSKSLGKRIHPHMFRKYFAQQCYLNGLNQYEIQGLLNHSDVKMIQVYTRQDQGHLRNALNRAFVPGGFQQKEHPKQSRSFTNGPASN